MADGLEAFERLLQWRYSCRGFLARPVERATIERVLEAAQRTPSWCNAQPWQVHLASGAATGRLRAALLAHVRSSKPEPELPFPREYRGVYLAPALYEAGFVSAAHTADDINATIAAAREALRL